MPSLSRTDTNACPNCGKQKKYWFPLCFECSEKESQRPKCEICGEPTPEGHTLCKKHWAEKQEEKKKLKSIDYVKSKKEIEFKDKYQGTYYFNSTMVRSKSELIICYFLFTNGINFQYERAITLQGKELRPDFVIDDLAGNFVILEHYGMDSNAYNKKTDEKRRAYEELFTEQPIFHYIETDEEDILNLKDKLGKKLNSTPLRRAFWK